MNGISLAEFAGVVTAFGVVLGAVFAFSKWQSEAQAKANEGRVSDLRDSLEELREDHDERIKEMRADFERQFSEVKQAMVHQSQIIERQEIMLSDYARHVGKLERMMAAAGMDIPDFETSPLRGRRNAET